MKKLFFAVTAGLLFLASCAQDKEKREDFKEDHSAQEMVNDVGDSAVSATDQTAVVTDTVTVNHDSTSVN